MRKKFQKNMFSRTPDHQPMKPIVIMIGLALLLTVISFYKISAAPNDTLIAASFNSGVDGFVYEDDPFNTSQPAYAAGTHTDSDGYLSSGGLLVELGGVNGDDITDMSGGWSYLLSLAQEEMGVMISFRYILKQTPVYEFDEFSRVLVTMDGVQYGRGSKDYIDHIGGDGQDSQGNSNTFDPTTEWQQVEVFIGDLAAGDHDLIIGAFNNQKTTDDEITTLVIDDVTITSGNSPIPVSDAKTLVNRLDITQFKSFNQGVANYNDRCRMSGCSDTDYYNALTWVESELQGMGYTTVRHEFNYNGNTGTNLWATKQGSTTPTEMYMISAHLDGRGGGTAYDDDGSGVALVMEAARVFAGSDVTTDNSVRFLFWDKEEVGLYGSNGYVQDRRSLQGTIDEPTWLGLITHDMILYDHGAGSPGTEQSIYADLDVEWRAGSTEEAASKDLAIFWRHKNGDYSADYPANAYNYSTNTDDTPFHPYVASVSVRENRRSLTSGSSAEWINPYYHNTGDIETSYSSDDTLLGFNAVQATVGTIAELAGVQISSSNNQPTADPQSVILDEDTTAAITLTGSDPDGDPITYHIASNPSHGSLSGNPPNLSYTPDSNFNGSDSFTFVVNDGDLNSDPALVSITINPVNDPPTANDQSVSTPENIPVEITLTGSDPDGDPLTAHITTDPAHGTLTGTTPEVTYTPDTGYYGADSFQFVMNDGTVNSVPATVSITIAHVNSPPAADDQSVTTDVDTPISIVLSGSDPDGDPLTFHLTSSPDHGSLSGTPPNLLYTPDTGFSGTDNFNFVVNDGFTNSSPALVTILVVGSSYDLPFFDDFESDLGWVVDVNGTDTASRGMWERAVPQATDYKGPKQLATTVSGTHDLVTGADAGSNAGSNDIDGGQTTIRSPFINLPAGQDITLSFSYYLAHAKNSDSNDYLRIKVVGSFGSTYVLYVQGSRSDIDANWRTSSVPLNEFAGQSIYIEIEAADMGRSSLLEAAVDDVSITASNASTTILEANFDTGSGDFTYQDDTFYGTSQPDYASGVYQPDGGYAGGGIQVRLGGEDNLIIHNISGGWIYTFNLAATSKVTISFWYKLTQSPDYDFDENSQALFSLDDVLYGTPPNQYLASLSGNGNGGIFETTGWQYYSIDIGDLSAGDHTIVLGCFNDRKSYSNEWTEVYYDEVLITGK